MADAPDLLDRLTWMAVNTMDNGVDALCTQAREAIQTRDAEIERLQAEVFAEAYKAELRALEIERLRSAGNALARRLDESGYGTNLERDIIAAWREAARD